MSLPQDPFQDQANIKFTLISNSEAATTQALSVVIAVLFEETLRQLHAQGIKVADEASFVVLYQRCLACCDIRNLTCWGAAFEDVIQTYICRAAAFTGNKGQEQEAYLVLDLCTINLAEYVGSQDKAMSTATIVEIFSCVCQAVSAMHQQSPPLSHR